MDELLKTVLLGAPNLAVALWVIYWSFKRQDKMDDERSKLIDQLLVLCAQNTALAATIAKDGAPPK